MDIFPLVNYLKFLYSRFVNEPVSLLLSDLDSLAIRHSSCLAKIVKILTILFYQWNENKQNNCHVILFLLIIACLQIRSLLWLVLNLGLVQYKRNTSDDSEIVFAGNSWGGNCWSGRRRKTSSRKGWRACCFQLVYKGNSRVK